MTPFRVAPFILCFLLACDDKSDGDSSTTATGALSCGSALRCADSEVCIEQTHPEVCTDRSDTAEECPEGSTATRCGGIGTPCCCEPAPDSTYRCYDASLCAEPATCDCAAAACEESSGCAAVGDDASRLFRCEQLAMP